MQPAVTIALRAARRAGTIIMRHFDRLDRVVVEQKGEHDLVSAVDREAESAIIDILRKTWGKMSEAAHQQALQLKLAPDAAALVGKALSS